MRLPPTRSLEPFGVEVDCDLSRPFDAATEAALRELFARHRLLLFRGQAVSRERQEALASLFGRVPDGGTDIRVVSNKGGEATLGSGELSFHGDMDFAPEPYNAVSLYALRVEDGKTSTRFVDGVRLWQRMSRDLRKRVEGIRLRNAYVGDYSRRDPDFALDASVPQHVYSLPRVHPVTGEKILVVSEAGTRDVVGLDPVASEALLQDIFAYCFQRPGEVFEHFWSVGDLILWDNLALMHARGAITGDAERTLQKVSSLQRTLAEQFGNGEWRDIARSFDREAVAARLAGG